MPSLRPTQAMFLCPSPSICSYQLPIYPAQCFSPICSLSDVVLPAHIFCSLFMLCWYQKQRDPGRGNNQSLSSSACCCGELGKRKFSSACRARLETALCRWCFKRALMNLSSPKIYNLDKCDFYFFFSLSFKLAIGTALTTAKSL